MLFLLKKIMMPYQDELMCDHHRVTCQIYESRDQSQWLTEQSTVLLHVIFFSVTSLPLRFQNLTLAETGTLF